MHHDFKGKFYEPVFSASIGFPYKVNGFANFYFPDTTGSRIVALNSSHSQKLAILTFFFTVNTFLSLTENDGNSTDSNVLVMSNVEGLHNPD